VFQTHVSTLAVVSCVCQADDARLLVAALTVHQFHTSCRQTRRRVISSTQLVCSRRCSLASW